MCGRYERRSDKQAIAEHFRAGLLDELYLEACPSYNIAPATRQPVITADPETGQRWLRIMRWGLIPPWTRALKEMLLSTVYVSGNCKISKRVVHLRCVASL